jgi:hypothetical protein
MGLHNYLFAFGGMGLGLYLIRKEVTPEKADYDQVLTLLLLVGILVISIGLALLPFAAKWTQIREIAVLGAGLFLGLPIALLLTVPIAGMEIVTYRLGSLPGIFALFLAAAMATACYVHPIGMLALLPLGLIALLPRTWHELNTYRRLLVGAWRE